jgi:uncharacterized protein
MRAALRGEQASDVPCATCTACCTSSQFVHIEPDETDTLAHIPAELLFAAPLQPPGHVLLGYDERGHCPMLVDGKCSIYAHRPRSCRTYDCRVFPASGLAIALDDPAKQRIAERARRWRFSFPTHADRVQGGAVRAAGAFLSEHADVLPGGDAPDDTTQLAVLAVEIHDVFLQRDEETGTPAVVDPDPGAIRTELQRLRNSRHPS